MGWRRRRRGGRRWARTPVRGAVGEASLGDGRPARVDAVGPTATGEGSGEASGDGSGRRAGEGSGEASEEASGEGSGGCAWVGRPCVRHVHPRHVRARRVGRRPRRPGSRRRAGRTRAHPGFVPVEPADPCRAGRRRLPVAPDLVDPVAVGHLAPPLQPARSRRQRLGRLLLAPARPGRGPLDRRAEATGPAAAAAVDSADAAARVRTTVPETTVSSGGGCDALAVLRPIELVETIRCVGVGWGTW